MLPKHVWRLDYGLIRRGTGSKTAYSASIENRPNKPLRSDLGTFTGAGAIDEAVMVTLAASISFPSSFALSVGSTTDGELERGKSS